MFYFAVFSGSLILSAIFGSIVIDLSLKRKVINKEGIPFLGSLPICLAAFNSITIFNFFSNRQVDLQYIFIAAALILILGLFDDFKNLSPFLKIFAQLIITIIFIRLTNIKIQIVFIPSFLNIILTIIWFLAITNAFNLLDIMDGLSGGLAIIISLAFFVASVLTNNFAMAILSVALAGSLLAFLRYNLAPAKIYMGNAGSLFIGFILAAISLSISYAPLGREVALITPLIILGLPIYDTGFVVLMRLMKGKSPVLKSNDHFALRLLALGYSKKEVLILMYSFASFFAICAISLSRLSNLAGLIVITILICTSFIIGKRIAGVKITDD